MKRALTILVAGVVVGGVGCGFDCNINGETEHFNDCAALQQRYDAEAAQSVPDGAVTNDILTCAEIRECEVDL